MAFTKPSFVKTLSGKVQGGNAIFTATIAGNPWPDVLWTVNGEPIDLNNPQFAITCDASTGEVSLTVQKVAEIGTASYNCELKNRLGSVSKKMNINLGGPKKTPSGEEIIPPKFEEPLKPSLEKTMGTFRCKVSGFPKPTVKWFIDNEPVESSDIHQISLTDDGYATMYVPDLTDIGTASYRCEASNEGGTVKSGKFDLKVPKKDESQKPKFLQQIKPIVTETKATFDAKVTGKPMPTIQWFVNDEEIVENSDNYTLETDQENGTTMLKVEDVSLITPAKYVCKASNSAGSASSIVTIGGEPDHSTNSTLIAPKFEEQMKHSVQKNDLLLTAKIAGVPVPAVEWYLNGELVVSDDQNNVTTHNKDNQISLLATNFRQHGNCEYKCIIYNRKGSATNRMELTLNPNEKPAAKTDDPDITGMRPKFVEPLTPVITDKSVEIEGRASGIPLPHLLWTVNEVEIFETDPNFSIKYRDDGKISFKFVDPLMFRGSRVNITCVAYNSRGECTSRVQIDLSNFSLEGEPKSLILKESTPSQKDTNDCFDFQLAVKPDFFQWYVEGEKYDDSHRKYFKLEFELETLVGRGECLAAPPNKTEVEVKLMFRRRTYEGCATHVFKFSPEAKKPVPAKFVSGFTVLEKTSTVCIMRAEFVGSPEIKVFLLIDSQPVPDATVSKSTKEIVIALRNVIYWGKTLTCQVKNTAGSDTIEEVVEYAPEDEKKLEDEVFIDRPVRVTVIEKETVHFSVTFGGYKPQIQWTSDGEDVKTLPDVKSETSEPVSMLIIPRNSPIMKSSTVTFIVTNEYSLVTSSYTVVEKVPILSKTYVSYVEKQRNPTEEEPKVVTDFTLKKPIASRKTMIITFKLKGNPFPEIQWIVFNEVIKPTNRKFKAIQKKDGTVTFEIPEGEIENGLPVEFLAENRIGSINYRFILCPTQPKNLDKLQPEEEALIFLADPEIEAKIAPENELDKEEEPVEDEEDKPKEKRMIETAPALKKPGELDDEDKEVDEETDQPQEKKQIESAPALPKTPNNDAKIPEEELKRQESDYRKQKPDDKPREVPKAGAVINYPIKPVLIDKNTLQFVVEFDGSKPKPTWTVDGKNVQLNKDAKIETKDNVSTLTLTNRKKYPKSEISFVVENEISKAQNGVTLQDRPVISDLVTDKTIKKKSPLDEAPKVVTPFTVKKVRKTTVIEGKVSARPASDIKWLVNGEKVPQNDPKFKPTTKRDGTTTFEVPDDEAEKGLEVTFVAENYLGKVDYIIVLSVEKPKTLELNPILEEFLLLCDPQISESLQPIVVPEDEKKPEETNEKPEKKPEEEPAKEKPEETPEEEDEEVDEETDQPQEKKQIESAPSLRKMPTPEAKAPETTKPDDYRSEKVDDKPREVPKAGAVINYPIKPVLIDENTLQFVVEFDGSKPKPTWTVDGKNVQLNKDAKIETKDNVSTLTLTNRKKYPKSEISFVVENEISKAQNGVTLQDRPVISGLVTDKTIKKKSPLDEAPKVVTPFTVKKVRKTTVIEGKVSARPASDIKWLVNGEKVPQNDPKFKPTTKRDGTTTFEVPDDEAEKGLEVTFVAENYLGKVDYIIVLSVEKPKTLELNPILEEFLLLCDPQISESLQPIVVPEDEKKPEETNEKPEKKPEEEPAKEKPEETPEEEDEEVDEETDQPQEKKQIESAPSLQKMPTPEAKAPETTKPDDYRSEKVDDKPREVPKAGAVINYPIKPVLIDENTLQFVVEFDGSKPKPTWTVDGKNVQLNKDAKIETKDNVSTLTLTNRKKYPKSEISFVVENEISKAQNGVTLQDRPVISDLVTDKTIKKKSPLDEAPKVVTPFTVKKVRKTTVIEGKVSARPASDIKWLVNGEKVPQNDPKFKPTTKRDGTTTFEVPDDEAEKGLEVTFVAENYLGKVDYIIVLSVEKPKTLELNPILEEFLLLCDPQISESLQPIVVPEDEKKPEETNEKPEKKPEEEPAKEKPEETPEEEDEEVDEETDQPQEKKQIESAPSLRKMPTPEAKAPETTKPDDYRSEKVDDKPREVPKAGAVINYPIKPVLIDENTLQFVVEFDGSKPKPTWTVDGKNVQLNKDAKIETKDNVSTLTLTNRKKYPKSEISFVVENEISKAQNGVTLQDRPVISDLVTDKTIKKKSPLDEAPKVVTPFTVKKVRKTTVIEGKVSARPASDIKWLVNGEKVPQNDPKFKPTTKRDGTTTFEVPDDEAEKGLEVTFVAENYLGKVDYIIVLSVEKPKTLELNPILEEFLLLCDPQISESLQPIVVPEDEKKPEETNEKPEKKPEEEPAKEKPEETPEEEDEEVDEETDQPQEKKQIESAPSLRKMPTPEAKAPETTKPDDYRSEKVDDKPREVPKAGAVINYPIKPVLIDENTLQFVVEFDGSKPKPTWTVDGKNVQLNKDAKIETKDNVSTLTLTNRKKYPKSEISFVVENEISKAQNGVTLQDRPVISDLVTDKTIKKKSPLDEAPKVVTPFTVKKVRKTTVIEGKVSARPASDIKWLVNGEKVPQNDPKFKPTTKRDGTTTFEVPDDEAEKGLEVTFVAENYLGKVDYIIVLSVEKPKTLELNPILEEFLLLCDPQISESLQPIVVPEDEKKPEETNEKPEKKPEEEPAKEKPEETPEEEDEEVDEETDQPQEKKQIESAPSLQKMPTPEAKAPETTKPDDYRSEKVDDKPREVPKAGAVINYPIKPVLIDENTLQFVVEFDGSKPKPTWTVDGKNVQLNKDAKIETKDNVSTLTLTNRKKYPKSEILFVVENEISKAQNGVTLQDRPVISDLVTDKTIKKKSPLDEAPKVVTPFTVKKVRKTTVIEGKVSARPASDIKWLVNGEKVPQNDPKFKPTTKRDGTTTFEVPDDEAEKGLEVTFVAENYLGKVDYIIVLSVEKPKTLELNPILEEFLLLCDPQISESLQPIVVPEDEKKPEETNEKPEKKPEEEPAKEKPEETPEEEDEEVDEETDQPQEKKQIESAPSLQKMPTPEAKAPETTKPDDYRSEKVDDKPREVPKAGAVINYPIKPVLTDENTLQFVVEFDGSKPKPTWTVDGKNVQLNKDAKIETKDNVSTLTLTNRKKYPKSEISFVVENEISKAQNGVTLQDRPVISDLVTDKTIKKKSPLDEAPKVVTPFTVKKVRKTTVIEGKVSARPASDIKWLVNGEKVPQNDPKFKPTTKRDGTTTFEVPDDEAEKGLEVTFVAENYLGKVDYIIVLSVEKPKTLELNPILEEFLLLCDPQISESLQPIVVPEDEKKPEETNEKPEKKPEEEPAKEKPEETPEEEDEEVDEETDQPQEKKQIESAPSLQKMPTPEAKAPETTKPDDYRSEKVDDKPREVPKAGAVINYPIKPVLIDENTLQFVVEFDGSKPKPTWTVDGKNVQLNKDAKIETKDNVSTLTLTNRKKYPKSEISFVVENEISKAQNGVTLQDRPVISDLVTDKTIKKKSPLDEAPKVVTPFTVKKVRKTTVIEGKVSARPASDIKWLVNGEKVPQNDPKFKPTTKRDGTTTFEVPDDEAEKGLEVTFVAENYLGKVDYIIVLSVEKPKTLELNPILEEFLLLCDPQISESLQPIVVPEDEKKPEETNEKPEKKPEEEPAKEKPEETPEEEDEEVDEETDQPQEKKQIESAPSLQKMPTPEAKAPETTKPDDYRSEKVDDKPREVPKAGAVINYPIKPVLIDENTLQFVVEFDGSKPKPTWTVDGKNVQLNKDAKIETKDNVSTLTLTNRKKYPKSEILFVVENEISKAQNGVTLQDRPVISDLVTDKTIKKKSPLDEAPKVVTPFTVKKVRKTTVIEGKVSARPASDIKWLVNGEKVPQNDPKFKPTTKRDGTTTFEVPDDEAEKGLEVTFVAENYLGKVDYIIVLSVEKPKTLELNPILEEFLLLCDPQISESLQPIVVPEDEKKPEETNEKPEKKPEEEPAKEKPEETPEEEDEEVDEETDQPQEKKQIESAPSLQKMPTPEAKAPETTKPDDYRSEKVDDKPREVPKAGAVINYPIKPVLTDENTLQFVVEFDGSKPKPTWTVDGKNVQLNKDAKIETKDNVSTLTLTNRKKYPKSEISFVVENEISKAQNGVTLQDRPVISDLVTDKTIKKKSPLDEAPKVVTPFTVKKVRKTTVIEGKVSARPASDIKWLVNGEKVPQNDPKFKPTTKRDGTTTFEVPDDEAEKGLEVTFVAENYLGKVDYIIVLSVEKPKTLELNPILEEFLLLCDPQISESLQPIVVPEDEKKPEETNEKPEKKPEEEPAKEKPEETPEEEDEEVDEETDQPQEKKQIESAPSLQKMPTPEAKAPETTKPDDYRSEKVDDKPREVPKAGAVINYPIKPVLIDENTLQFVVEFDGSKPKPTWTVDGKNVQLNKDAKIETKDNVSTLTLTNRKKYPKSEILFVVENEISKAQNGVTLQDRPVISDLVTDKTIKKKSPLDEAPKVVTPFTVKKVRKTTVIEGKVSARPASDIKWLVNGEKVPQNDPKFKPTTKRDGTTTFEVPDDEAEKGLEVTFVAENYLGKVDYIIVLSVEKPKTLELNPILEEFLLLCDPQISESLQPIVVPEDEKKPEETNEKPEKKPEEEPAKEKPEETPEEEDEEVDEETDQPQEKKQIESAPSLRKMPTPEAKAPETTKPDDYRSEKVDDKPREVPKAGAVINYPIKPVLIDENTLQFVVEFDGSKPKPTWTVDGKNVQLNKDAKIETKDNVSTLTLTNRKKYPKSEISFVVENEISKAQNGVTLQDRPVISDLVTDKTIKKKSPLDEAPKVVTPFTVKKVRKTTVIEGKVSARPASDIKWLVNGEKVPQNDPKFKPTTKRDGTTTFEVPDDEAEKGLEVTFVAENYLGKVDYIIVLSVEKPKTLELNPILEEFLLLCDPQISESLQPIVVPEDEKKPEETNEKPEKKPEEEPAKEKPEETPEEEDEEVDEETDQPQEKKQIESAPSLQKMPTPEAKAPETTKPDDYRSEKVDDKPREVPKAGAVINYPIKPVLIDENTLQFVVEFDGSKPKPTWTVDGKNVQLNKDAKIETKDNVSTLTLTNRKKYPKSEISFVVENEISKAQNGVTLQDRPVISGLVTDKTIKKKSPLDEAPKVVTPFTVKKVRKTTVIEGKVSARPASDIKWLVNGEKVPQNDPKFKPTTKRDGTTTFEVPDDEAEKGLEVTFVAENYLGKVDYIIVLSVEKPKTLELNPILEEFLLLCDPQISESLQPIVVPEDEKKPEETNEKPEKKPEEEPAKEKPEETPEEEDEEVDEETDQPQEKKQIESAPSLRKMPTPEAKAPETTKPDDYRSEKVDDKPREVPKAGAVINYPIKPVLIDENTLQFVVEFDGSKPKPTWTVDGKNVQLNKDAKIETKDNVSTLTLTNRKKYPKSEISFVVENEISKAQNGVTLQDRPVISDLVTDKTIKKKSPLDEAPKVVTPFTVKKVRKTTVIEGKVSARPASDIKWLVNGEKVPQNDPKFKPTTKRDGTTTFEVPDDEAEKGLEVTFVAENYLGKVDYIIVLSVEKPKTLELNPILEEFLLLCDPQISESLQPIVVPEDEKKPEETNEKPEKKPEEEPAKEKPEETPEEEDEEVDEETDQPQEKKQIESAPSFKKTPESFSKPEDEKPKDGINDKLVSVPTDGAKILQPLEPKLLDDDTLKFVVDFDGKDPKPSWTVDGRNPRFNKDVKIETKGKTSTLVLSNKSKYPKSEFNFTVENDVAISTSSFAVVQNRPIVSSNVVDKTPKKKSSLDEPPKIVINFTTKRTGKATVVEAKIGGKPFPEVTWLESGSPVDASDPKFPQVVKKDGTVSFEVPDSEIENGKEIKFLATNYLGSLDYTFVLAPEKPKTLDLDALMEALLLVADPKILQSLLSTKPEEKKPQDKKPVEPEESVDEEIEPTKEDQIESKPTPEEPKKQPSKDIEEEVEEEEQPKEKKNIESKPTQPEKKPQDEEPKKKPDKKSKDAPEEVDEDIDKPKQKKDVESKPTQPGKNQQEEEPKPKPAEDLKTKKPFDILDPTKKSPKDGESKPAPGKLDLPVRRKSELKSEQEKPTAGKFDSPFDVKLKSKPVRRGSRDVGKKFDTPGAVVLKGVDKDKPTTGSKDAPFDRRGSREEKNLRRPSFPGKSKLSQPEKDDDFEEVSDDDVGASKVAEIESKPTVFAPKESMPEDDDGKLDSFRFELIPITLEDFVNLQKRNPKI